jgi:hypothetical protein
MRAGRPGGIEIRIVRGPEDVAATMDSATCAECLGHRDRGRGTVPEG